MSARTRALALAAALAGSAAFACTAAPPTPPAPPAVQQPLDRTAPPEPGPQPTLTVPAWTETRLSNGARLVVAPKRDLPLVAFRIDFIGGATSFEPADRTGAASFAAELLSEGTATRTAEELSNAQQLLGTSIDTRIGDESGSIRFTALSDRFEPALELLADMMLHPTFPADALERVRGRTLVALQQRKDQPNAIAANVFARTVYGDTHPYGRVLTEESARAITRDDVVAFHQAYFRPGRAVITVTGDVDPDGVKAAVERALAAWPEGGAAPSFDYGPVPEPGPTTIYLVDKPGAAQSVFAIGAPGPARDTPDYYALEVMNTLLGGLFQSRLNHEIREVRGWSYGVGSGFAYGRGPGAFRAGGGIATAKTDSALVEFMRHLDGVRGGIPFTGDEMTVGKESMIQSLPQRFASVNAIAGAVATLYVDDLPRDHYQAFADHVSAVTADDLVRVAREHIDLDHLYIVIVGDRSVIEAPLRATGVAPIRVLDAAGRPVEE